MLDLAGKPFDNFFPKVVRIFLQSRSTIFTGFRGGGRGGSEAANSRQRSPIAAHEVNTQTPPIQGNMGGVLSLFLMPDLSFLVVENPYYRNLLYFWKSLMTQGARRWIRG